MMRLADSDLFFYIGLGLEGFVEKSKETLKNEHVKLVPTAEDINLPKSTDTHDEEEEHHDTDTHTDVNPHVWLDPIYSKEMAAVIRDALIKQMPEHKDLFNKNFQQIALKLDELNTNYEQTITKAKHKKIIVTHAAFGYWEKRYGIEQISISGLSTANEPTQKELEKSLQLLKMKDYTICYSNKMSNRNLEKSFKKKLGLKHYQFTTLLFYRKKILKIMKLTLH